MGSTASDMPILHDSGAVTPPPTPTSVCHSKSNSASDLAAALSGLRRGDSISSCERETATLEDLDMAKPGSTEPRTFPYDLTDYEIDSDSNGKKKTLGSGAWSEVYLARPCLPLAHSTALENPSAPIPRAAAAAVSTPPVTPVKFLTSSLPRSGLVRTPPLYAIKHPASRSAKRVLGEESLILSYLSRFPSSSAFIVPFYGQDMRTEALVLKAMEGGSLDDWIARELNNVSEAERTQKLADVFPALATKLLDGLAWMHAQGCVHADIKPGNILLEAPTSPDDPVPRVLYTDFSAATLSLPSSTPTTAPTPLGGGTWTFLDPTLLTKPTSSAALPSPTPSADLWALAMTLLVLVTGTSPFACAAANRFQQREMIKQGAPLTYVAYGDAGPRSLARIAALGKALGGWDVSGWFARVLVREMGGRVGVEEWKKEVGKGVVSER
ncbi:kinase-like domain-containing protein [Massariosphaeria phaeospora]|uniref:Kinase-like domain-containing protein n=1 Tax=Massariosphaeria phaeospora TaxID=100035 RepID=A0A7C8I5S4_9PLEO|nr:kinase-like domain-containing protein [Massariosphaeria phaeospora]